MKSIVDWFGKSTYLGLVVLAILVGLGGAVGSAIFHSIIYYFTLVFFGFDGNSDFISYIEQIPTWQRLLAPTLGGLLVGLIYFFTKLDEAEGEGVPEVMEAINERRSKIKPIVAPVKIITAAITIGSGGSAGREGPVIQIGSAIGSTIAQLTKQKQPEVRLLLASGAAAAIGGTFGAPIAGLLFTIEVLKQRLSNLHQTLVIALSAFIGAYGAELLTGGNGLTFNTEFTWQFNIIELLVIFLLGVISAMAALLFGRILKLNRQLFKKITLPHLIKPAIGGFFIGLIGLYLPYVHEPAAYPLMIDLIAFTSLPLTILGTILVVKILATGITLGSGGSGGIFAPLLLIGAIVGSTFVTGLIFLDIDIISSPAALVLAGMAAVFAGAAHAPLTATFITYELTGNISLLVPVLAACYVAYNTAKLINRDSIYHQE